MGRKREILVVKHCSFKGVEFLVFVFVFAKSHLDIDAIILRPYHVINLKINLLDFYCILSTAYNCSVRDRPIDLLVLSCKQARCSPPL